MKRLSFITPILVLFCLSLGCRPPRVSSALAAGIAAAQADNWDEALRHWQTFLEKEPRSAAAHNNLAVAFEKKGDWREARREYETALALDPDNRTIRDNFERFKSRQEAARADGGAAGRRAP